MPCTEIKEYHSIENISKDVIKFRIINRLIYIDIKSHPTIKLGVIKLVDTENNSYSSYATQQPNKKKLVF